jgi:hypothetical protein
MLGEITQEGDCFRAEVRNSSDGSGFRNARHLEKSSALGVDSCVRGLCKGVVS